MVESYKNEKNCLICNVGLFDMVNYFLLNKRMEVDFKKIWIQRFYELFFLNTYMKNLIIGGSSKIGRNLNLNSNKFDLTYYKK